MHFGNPQFLWLLLVWPILVWLGWAALAWRRRVASRLGRPQLLERLYPASISHWRRRRLFLLLIAILLLMIAAARPQYGRIEQTRRSVGTNVLIALDCSASMRAGDVAPSRIERAKQDLSLILNRLLGNRVGIIAFAGVAFLQCPMTLDHGMATLVLESLDTNSVGVAGTNIGAAIETAVAAFERGSIEGGRALVLLTDGEDNEGKGVEAARKAADKHIVIYAIGIGTSRGTPLMEDGGSFKEDRSGKKVNTKLDMATLEKIAKATGGVAFDAGGAPSRAIDAIIGRIQRQEQVELEGHKQVIYQDRFQWFLAPALLLIVWSLLLRPERTRVESVPHSAAPSSPAESGKTA